MIEESTERKQVFVGTIRKCPNCGTQITTDTVKCPACGFIIEKENVSVAMEEFTKKFVSFNSDTEKKDFVETYPIPNNKNDIRGFLSFASSQRDKDYANSKIKVFWVTVWNNKCRSIINQAYDVFGTDTDFMQYLRNYKSDIEKSSKEIKKINNKLILGMIGKILAVVVLVLAVLGFLAIQSKKRSELISGCVVPKENVKIYSNDSYSILDDAKIETVNISKRDATNSGEPVWCLDTVVTVKVKVKKDIYSNLKNGLDSIPGYLEYSKSPDYIEPFFVTFISEQSIECTYQSKTVTKHSFDNVHGISQSILNMTENNIDDVYNCEFKLTQIAGSKKECEDLAIELHKLNKFYFEIARVYDRNFDEWDKHHR